MKDETLRKLELLREKYAADRDSLDWINQAERDLRTLIDQKRMSENPIFMAIVKDSQKKLDEINALLQLDETLTNEKRLALFHEKKVWKFQLDRFAMKAHANAIEMLEITIDQRLGQ